MAKATGVPECSPSEWAIYREWSAKQDRISQTSHLDALAAGTESNCEAGALADAIGGTACANSPTRIENPDGTVGYIQDQPEGYRECLYICQANEYPCRN